MPSVQCKTTLFAVKEKKNDLYSLVLYRIQWIKSESSDSFTQTDGDIAECFSTSIAVSCTRRSVAFTASFTCGTSSSHMFGYQTSPRWPCPKQCKSPPRCLTGEVGKPIRVLEVFHTLDVQTLVITEGNPGPDDQTLQCACLLHDLHPDGSTSAAEWGGGVGRSGEGGSNWMVSKKQIFFCQCIADMCARWQWQWHTQKQSSNICQKPGPTNLSDGVMTPWIRLCWAC